LSRLESFIRRMEAQRDCLAEAARLVRGIEGPVLELGLGNGRTYDHLREILPGREIFAFDRAVNAHPDCIPDDDHVILGDLPGTLDGWLARHGAPAALVHCDAGTGDAASNISLAERMGPAIDAVMAPGGVVVCDQAIVGPRLYLTVLPMSVRPGRYFMYRVGGS
jgi:hypothetical protein